MFNYVNLQNTSQINAMTAQNTSQTNYINYNNISVTNAINSIASIGEPNWNANYSTFLTHITWAQAMNGTLATTLYVDNQNTSNNNYLVSYVSLNNQSLNNYITSYVTSNNASLNNYVNYNNISVTNAINSIASIGEPNWNANYSTFLTHITWAQVMNGTLLQSSQWNATNTSYMTGDNFTLQNTSLRNYILYVNSTNGVGSGTYNDAWINETIYNKTQVDIIAATSDLHTHNASNITSPIWVNKTGDTMSGNLNMSSNNITAVDCITFASGGKICSG